MLTRFIAAVILAMSRRGGKGLDPKRYQITLTLLVFELVDVGICIRNRSWPNAFMASSETALFSRQLRNQSPTAIVGVLERDNQESAAGKVPIR